MRVADVKDAHCSIYTFGCKRQSPPNCHYTFDVTSFRDPAGQGNMRHLDGRATIVRNFVAQETKLKDLLDLVEITLRDAIPATGGKAWTTIGIMDHHGVWIAPAVGELLAEHLDVYAPDIPYVLTHLDADHHKLISTTLPAKVTHGGGHSPYLP